jgi:hypothetical protein
VGYTTDFVGEFDITPALDDNHVAYLRQFANTRRMKRDPVKASDLADPVRLSVGLPVGDDGGYFVGGQGICGQDFDNSILDYNGPPAGQPGLWCQWIPGEDDQSLVWDQSEKFYAYVEWLRYLIQHFFQPWGYSLSGDVEWQGEDSDDKGIIQIVNNVVRVGKGVITYQFKDES